MMSIVTYINIINDNIVGKMNKIFISEVCIKLVVALALIGTQEVALSYMKVGDPWFRGFDQLSSVSGFKIMVQKPKF